MIQMSVNYKIRQVFKKKRGVRDPIQPVRGAHWRLQGGLAWATGQTGFGLLQIRKLTKNIFACGML